MIPVINWLHISDIHLKEDQDWSQQVVLKALLASIRQQLEDGIVVHFILVSGDLTYSGKPAEFVLVRQFLDELSTTAQIPKERIYCIPGNHDVERNRQKMCFEGARATLKNQNRIDELLSSAEEIETLLLRHSGFNNFLKTYLNDQVRATCAYGMGYVSNIKVQEIQVSIIGLNSAWLSEGGTSDQGKLLIGERQIIDTLKLAEQGEPHITISMGHHPFHWLQDFDRRIAESRISSSCHFYHCGHLHETEFHNEIRQTSQCLVLSAGALFDSRFTHNSYLMISLDICRANTNVRIIQYEPKEGNFSLGKQQDFALQLGAHKLCSVAELTDSLVSSDSSLRRIGYILAALLLGIKTEFPINFEEGYVFGSFDFLKDMTDSELTSATTAFVNFKNILKLFYNKKPITEIFQRYGGSVKEYGALILKLCEENPELNAQIIQRDEEVRKFAITESKNPLFHMKAMFEQLEMEEDWPMLQQLATRYIQSDDEAMVLIAKRMLALSLSHSQAAHEKKSAIDLYVALDTNGILTAKEKAVLCSLFVRVGNIEEAKKYVLQGIQAYPEVKDTFYELGQNIVHTTGDRKFRDELITAHNFR